jgi:hypothetical protein
LDKDIVYTLLNTTKVGVLWFDYDIIATTNDPNVINGVYKDEVPVICEMPKPEKILFTDDDLHKADLLSFGSIIGQITNKSTSIYVLLNRFEKDSEEYKVLMNRLKMCTKLQAFQIDQWSHYVVICNENVVNSK